MKFEIIINNAPQGEEKKSLEEWEKWFREKHQEKYLIKVNDKRCKDLSSFKIEIEKLSSSANANTPKITLTGGTSSPGISRNTSSIFKNWDDLLELITPEILDNCLSVMNTSQHLKSEFQSYLKILAKCQDEDVKRFKNSKTAIPGKIPPYLIVQPNPNYYLYVDGRVLSPKIKSIIEGRPPYEQNKDLPYNAITKLNHPYFSRYNGMWDLDFPFVFVALQYRELAHLNLCPVTINELFERPYKVCTETHWNGGKWESLLFFLNFTIVESIRNPQWFVMAKMVKWLVQHHYTSWAHAVDNGSDSFCWPPSAKHAVQTMQGWIDNEIHIQFQQNNEEDTYWRYCRFLLAFWLAARWLENHPNQLFPQNLRDILIVTDTDNYLDDIRALAGPYKIETKPKKVTEKDDK